MKKQTNFDIYLKDQLKDQDFAARFKKAGEAWDVAIQLASLRKESGMSQKELARRVGTSQQQISRLESTAYEGHSLSMLRRVADALGAKVHVEIERQKSGKEALVAERKSVYKPKRTKSLSPPHFPSPLAEEGSQYFPSPLAGEGQGEGDF